MLKPLLLVIFYLTTQQVEKPSDYRDYHRGINEAEELVIQHKFNAALERLNEVFDSFDFVFVRDYKIAVQLALKTTDTTMALAYLEKGMSMGWSVNDIKKNKFLKPLILSAGAEALHSQSKNLRQTYYNRLNDSLRQLTEEMFKKDQKKAMGALLRIGNRAQEKYGNKKFAPHSEKQLARLEKILECCGYPGEKLIGNDFWTSTVLSHHNSISKEYVSRDTLYQRLEPLLRTALDRGEMSLAEFAIIEDWKIAVETGHSTSVYGFLGRIQSEKALAKVELNRKLLGLRSIALRNALFELGRTTGMDFYLPGQPWQDGKITISTN
ncbi:MAG: hypothetical protein ACR2MM_07900 [Flavobacteriaceae bacterium]